MWCFYGSQTWYVCWFEDSDLDGLDEEAVQRLRALQVLQGDLAQFGLFEYLFVRLQKNERSCRSCSKKDLWTSIWTDFSYCNFI